MNTSDTQSSNWFYIKHLSTDKVIATCKSCTPLQADDYVRSQVIVTQQQYTDDELWCWDENYLKNKSTGLVLDIRKGRLRLIEDTEICLYYKKPHEMSHNQMWAIRPAVSSESTTATEHPLFRNKTKQTSLGIVIYSICNSDWVLDICCPEEDNLTEGQSKLILFPQHQNSTENQRWEFVPEDNVYHHSSEEDTLLAADPGLIFEDNSLDSSVIDENGVDFASGSSSISCESIGFAHGLTPAKRSSQSSLSSINRKESLEDIYIYQTQQSHPFFHI